MAQNVTKKDPKSFEALKELKGDEIVQKLKSGDITVPSADRPDFIHFAQMNADERTAFVNQLSTSQTPPPPPPVGSPSGQPAAGAKEGGDDKGVTPPPPPPPSGAKPDAGSEPIDLVEVTKLQENLRKQRQVNSKQGSQIKTLTEQIVSLQSKISEIEKTAPGKGAVAEMPDVPAAPDPDKYAEGIYDNAFKADMERYKNSLKEYKKNLTDYVTSVKPPWAEKIASQLDEVEKKATAAHEFVSSTKEKMVEDETTKTWGDMWASVGKLQKSCGLETTVPIETINANQLIVNAKDSKREDGTPFYTPEEVATADRIIKSLPEGVYDKYKKVVKIVSNLYEFGQGSPQRMYSDLDEDLAWQAAIRKAGLANEIKALKPVEVSPRDIVDRLAVKQQNDNNAAAHMPGDQIGASEAPLGQELSKSEKQKKLLEMNQQLRKNSQLFRDSNFMAEFNKLRAGVGL